MKTNYRRKVQARQKGFKSCGFEYWGTRDSKQWGGAAPGAITKDITHKRERRLGAKKAVKEQLEDIGGER